MANKNNGKMSLECHMYNEKYAILDAPIKTPFIQFTPEQAKIYFDWYLENIPNRIECLRAFTGIKLDYSPKSLISIWNWVIKNAKFEMTSINEARQNYGAKKYL